MTDNIIMTRKNRILALREEQLCRNRLAMDGGRPYIDARLWRAPNESALSWEGSKTEPGVVGRRDRACFINDAGRIASKISQYLFSRPTDRPGVDEEWARDVTNEGVGLEQFWMDVSDELTCGQWCWLQTDRAAPEVDEAGNIVTRSVADKVAAGDFIFWRLWPATSVPDWYFDRHGNLVWLLTQEESIDASDPFKEPVEVQTRTLWQTAKGGCHFTRWETREGETRIVSDGTISPLEDVPFVLVGKPSCKPWWFDDVELLVAQLLNLDSLHIENLVRAVFPQLVVPESLLDNLETRLIERIGEKGEKVIQAVREVLRGLDTPLIESTEDKGITRFIQPSIQDLQGLPTEANRKRQQLFDQVGLALFNKETRQVQSAEAKQFDHLDTESTLRARARLLQTAEERIVALSSTLDPTWKPYEPTWPDTFDVTDPAADTAALATLAQFSHLTLTQRKVVLKAVTKLMAALVDIAEDEMTAINKEIDELTEEDFAVDITPDYARTGAGGEEGEEGGEE